MVNETTKPSFLERASAWLSGSKELVEWKELMADAIKLSPEFRITAAKEFQMPLEFIDFWSNGSDYPSARRRIQFVEFACSFLAQ